jgi:hypothetical protein
MVMMILNLCMSIFVALAQLLVHLGALLGQLIGLLLVGLFRLVNRAMPSRAFGAPPVFPRVSPWRKASSKSAPPSLLHRPPPKSYF